MYVYLDTLCICPFYAFCFFFIANSIFSAWMMWVYTSMYNSSILSKFALSATFFLYGPSSSARFWVLLRSDWVGIDRKEGTLIAHLDLNLQLTAARMDLRLVFSAPLRDIRFRRFHCHLLLQPSSNTKKFVPNHNKISYWLWFASIQFITRWWVRFPIKFIYSTGYKNAEN